MTALELLSLAWCLTLAALVALIVHLYRNPPR